jgi:outer membrane protein assembly factor BamD
LRLIPYLVVLLFSVSACSSLYSSDEEEETVAVEKRTAEELYNQAVDNIAAKNFQTGIDDLQKIEQIYPFSPLAAKGQVMAAYANYRDEEYDSAVLGIERFLRLNPAHPDAAYMYYLKALAFYEQISDIKRDQKITEEALTALREVSDRFPETKYARDASLKIDLVNDHLAGKEMEIGRFYLKRREYAAAANRFKTVIEQFQTTSQTKEALYRLTESYLMLGLADQAQKTASVLGHNYPDSKWYRYAYALLAEGKASPAQTNNAWYESLLSEEDEKPKELPKENEADSWFDALRKSF